MLKPLNYDEISLNSFVKNAIDRYICNLWNLWNTIKYRVGI